MYRFGWWSTGRDRDALNLFDAVYDACSSGVIPGEFSYCFVSRGRGESAESDALISRIEECGIPVVLFSARDFQPELRKSNREQWRNRYHHEVLQKVRAFDAGAVVLAGYMWVVSPEVCGAFPIINLHPAEPDGPAGTWQEVIWELLEKRAGHTGVMMHLVTPELDKGPPVSYCRFSIRGGSWEPLWKEFESELESAGSIQALKEKFGESLPLFAEIRRQGVKRELPLIVHTLRALAKGEFSIRDGVLYDASGKKLKGPWDLTAEIEAVL